MGSTSDHANNTHSSEWVFFLFVGEADPIEPNDHRPDHNLNDDADESAVCADGTLLGLGHLVS
jgi:hypothetical protein